MWRPHTTPRRRGGGDGSGCGGPIQRLPPAAVPPRLQCTMPMKRRRVAAAAWDPRRNPPGGRPQNNRSGQSAGRAGAWRRGHCAAAARPAGSPSSLPPGRRRPQTGPTGRRGRGRCRHQRRAPTRASRAPSPALRVPRKRAPAGTRPAAAGRPHRPPSPLSPCAGRRASPLGQRARRALHLLSPPPPPNQTPVNGTLPRVRKRDGGRGPAAGCGQPARPCNDGCAGTRVDPKWGELPTARDPPPTRPPTSPPARTEATGRDGGGEEEGEAQERKKPAVPAPHPPPQCDVPATRGPKPPLTGAPRGATPPSRASPAPPHRLTRAGRTPPPPPVTAPRTTSSAG